MVEVPSRADLEALAEEAGRLAAVAVFGFVQRLNDGRVSVSCVCPGATIQWTMSAADLPPALGATGDDLRQTAWTGTDVDTDGSLNRVLRAMGTRHLASACIRHRVPPTRFWVGSSREGAFTPAEVSQFEATAASAGRRLDAPLPPDAALDRLQRLGRVGDLLPALLRVLDVRDVFTRVSAIAQRAVPHDMLLLRLFADGSRAQTTLCSDRTVEPTSTLPHDVSAVLSGELEFSILDDHRVQPVTIHGVPTVVDARSSLRLALRFDDEVIGDLTFLSREPRRFTSGDAGIGRRLADHAAVALAHCRLAEDSRRAAALQERATNLEVLDGLLATLTGVLDVREVFDRVSAIAQKVLPHDAMSISELIGNREKVRIHASHGLGELNEPFDMIVPEPAMVTDPWDYRLIDDVREHPEYAKGPGWAAGMRSMLFVSIRMEDRNYGGLNFYSRTPGHFVHDDVLVARRITDHVALALSHRRLADEARRSEELRARATSLELLDDLLTALTDTGELRDVLATVSGVVRRVLAHEGTALILPLPDSRRARIYATSGFPEPIAENTPVPDHLLGESDAEHDIVDDLTQETAPLFIRLAGLGFRSLIRVPIRMDGRFVGALALLANAGAAFKASDALVVRRMADRLTVTLARDREIAASQRADEATARAARLEARVRTLTEELDARTGYRRVVGQSLPWRQVLTQAAQVAATEATVLLLGESGTGKEVVARFLHRGSSRNGGPFVALNCAALPEHLLEAELFGYERGAYTGATQSKPGQLEQAAGGTLFLDEVAEMSATAQPKFLRVLQEREFQRLGGTRVLRTDARIVAATNRDLQRGIANGQFREDLYYRLNVFAIRLPPLRERRDDILPLSEAFIAELGRGLGRPPAGISRDAREMLVEYTWPGNVRELRNVLERAAILCDGGLITADLLAINVTAPVLRESFAPGPVRPEPVVQSPPAAIARARADGGAVRPPVPGGDLNSVERAMIQTALQNARFNKSKAAKELGLTRHQLYIRMRKHGFD